MERWNVAGQPTDQHILAGGQNSDEFCYGRVSKTIAEASIDSSLPTGPTRSPVLALTFMQSAAIPSSAAIRSAICFLYGLSLGGAGRDGAVEVADLPAALANCSRGFADKEGGIGPVVLGIVVGNHSPISPRAAAPRMASVMACSRTSPSL